jgi:hypothetical protein
MRKEHPVFAGGGMEVIPTENVHVLGYARLHNGERAVVFANFSENEQPVSARVIAQNIPCVWLGVTLRRFCPFLK